MFQLSVALRFLREGRFQTVLIIVGISVGIAVQVFLSALISGLQKDLVGKTVGTAPHITAEPFERRLVSMLPDSVPVLSSIAASSENPRPVRAWQPIASQVRSAQWCTVVSPVLEGSAFASRGDRIAPVLLRGVMLAQADTIYRIRERLVSGDAVLGANGVIVGSELARELRLRPGSTILLTSSGGPSDVFTVRGIFDFETKALNGSWVFMDLPRAQVLFDAAGGISALEMQVPAVFDAQRISDALASSFPRLRWTSWQENNVNLLAALRSQSSSSNLIQFLVIVAVTLGVSSVLAVSAIQKARQIGILKAIGATRALIGQVFFIMGTLLGFSGSILGCFAGYGLITMFLKATADSAGRPIFPLSIEPELFIVSVVIATAAGMIAAFIPARRSAKLNPIEVIRNG